MTLNEAGIIYKSYISADVFVLIISFQVLSTMCLMDIWDIMALKTFQKYYVLYHLCFARASKFTQLSLFILFIYIVMC